MCSNVKNIRILYVFAHIDITQNMYEIFTEYVSNIFSSKISSYIRITKKIKVAPIQQTCFFADFEFGG